MTDEPQRVGAAYKVICTDRGQHRPRRIALSTNLRRRWDPPPEDDTEGPTVWIQWSDPHELGQISYVHGPEGRPIPRPDGGYTFDMYCRTCGRKPQLREEAFAKLLRGLTESGRDTLDISALPF